VALSNKNLFLTALEVGKSEIRCQCGWILEQAYFQVYRQPTSYILLRQRGERERKKKTSQVSSYKGIHPIMVHRNHLQIS
jgi:hypothetical protein